MLLFLRPWREKDRLTAITIWWSWTYLVSTVLLLTGDGRFLLIHAVVVLVQMPLFVIYLIRSRRRKQRSDHRFNVIQLIHYSMTGSLDPTMLPPALQEEMKILWAEIQLKSSQN